MATISVNNIARAIYESTNEKSGVELEVILKNTVKLLSEKHALGKSKEILNKLQKLIDKNEEVVRAKISSKAEIKKGVVSEIEHFIKKRYKVKNAILEFETDDKFLGGIKIEVGDEIIDMTLKSKINRLKNYLVTN
ncbi:MAG: F0F1 ATP synthase subunit delta [Candidatus Paceibacterota bacterium]|jgi:F-type H+-transporting ATPase subunit delta